MKKNIAKQCVKTLLMMPKLVFFLGSCLAQETLSPIKNQDSSEKILIDSPKKQNNNLEKPEDEKILTYLPATPYPLIASSTTSPNNEKHSSSMKQTDSIDQSKLNIINVTEGWNKNLLVEDVLYDLYIPPKYNKDSQPIIKSLLVLPGWNFSRSSWIENTDLVKYADKYGYVLILPEMGKTLYESRYYPETKMKWNSIPGGQFMKEKFIPTMQQRHNLLLMGQHNTMLGLSTGGRGVVLIALENPDLFVAGASLSGDFSQDNMPTDKLMTSVYGSFSQFPQRWKGKDNPQNRVNEWKIPLYLAHGTADNIVLESQSRLFYNTLIKHHQGNSLVEYHAVQGAGHDYNFWGGQLEPVFQFIDRDWQSCDFLPQ